MELLGRKKVKLVILSLSAGQLGKVRHICFEVKKKKCNENQLLVGPEEQEHHLLERRKIMAAVCHC